MLKLFDASRPDMGEFSVENLVTGEQVEAVDAGVMEASTTIRVSGLSSNPGKKRERSPSHEMWLFWPSSDNSNDPAQKRSKTKATERVTSDQSVCGPVGLGRSSIAARNARKSAEAGTFVINE